MIRLFSVRTHFHLQDWLLPWPVLRCANLGINAIAFERQSVGCIPFSRSLWGLNCSMDVRRGGGRGSNVNYLICLDLTPHQAQFNYTQATALEGMARSTNTLQKSMIRDIHTYHGSVELETYFVKWISPLN